MLLNSVVCRPELDEALKHLQHRALIEPQSSLNRALIEVIEPQ
jgi:hypothetical protein